MKNILIAVLGLFLVVSCKNTNNTKDYATISGTITNSNSNEITIANQSLSKVITLDTSGNFKDTLKVEDGFYMFKNGDQKIVIQLKNGFDINLSYDANKYTESLTFSGLGAVANNYFADKTRLQESDGFLDFNSYFSLEKPEFDAKVNEIKSTLDNMLTNAQGLDSIIVANEKRTNQQLISFLSGNYNQKHEMLTVLAKGKTSPTFTYPDINGKKVSLSSLKGKYVYIDVWATWCGPCKVQIPYLKEIEEKYEGKNIAFVGLSIDAKKNKGKWEQMVKERGLGGYQVLADNDWKSDFIKSYYITGIPRFILIDPQGNIVSADALRPSEPALLKLFDDLKI